MCLEITISNLKFLKIYGLSTRADSRERTIGIDSFENGWSRRAAIGESRAIWGAVPSESIEEVLCEAGIGPEEVASFQVISELLIHRLRGALRETAASVYTFGVQGPAEGKTSEKEAA